MVQFDSNKKEIVYKIVYFGPPSSGKTTIVKFIYEKTSRYLQSNLSSIAATPEEEIFIDFLSINVPLFSQVNAKFNLFNLPGDLSQNAITKRFLQDTDGVVFVADSSTIDENIAGLKTLEQNMQEYGLPLANLPLVIQWNKRDLPNVLPIKELHQKINYLDAPEFSSSAISGEGVFSALEKLAFMIIESNQRNEHVLEKMKSCGIDDREVKAKTLFSAPPEEKDKKQETLSPASGEEKSQKMKSEAPQTGFSIARLERETPSGKIVVLKFCGRIDPTSSGMIKEKVQEEYMKNNTYLVLNLEAVDYIHTVGFGILLEIANRAKIMGGETRVSGLKDRFKIAFELMGMDKTMPLFEAEDDAIASFPVSKKQSASQAPETHYSQADVIEEKPQEMDKASQRSFLVNRYRMLSPTLTATQNIKLTSFVSKQKKNVYLSYDAEDLATVRRIEEDLQQEGYEVWRDRNRVQGNVEWNEGNGHLIQDANAVILLWTGNAQKSVLVKNEWIMARAVGKAIIVCFPESYLHLPLPLQDVATVNLREYKNGLEMLKEKLSSRTQPSYIYGMLPYFSYLPFSNTNDFVGRDEELLSLFHKMANFKRVLISQPPSASVVEGIGKTRLALEFVYRFGFRFTDGIVWINGGNNWHKELQRAAYELGLTEESPDFSLGNVGLHKLRSYIQTHPDFLLVLDNIQDPSELNREIAPGFNPLSFDCHLIATTSSSQVIPGTVSLQLSLLSAETSFQLLTSLRKPESNTEIESARKICEIVGGIPMALDLIRKFLNKNPSINFLQYFHWLEKGMESHRQSSSREGQSNPDLMQDYGAVLSLILKRQYDSIQDDYSQRLFEIAVFSPKGKLISKDTLALLAGISPDTKRIQTYIKTPFEALQALCLIEDMGEDYIRLHPSIQDYMEKSYGSKPEQEQKIKKRVVEYLAVTYRDLARLEKDYMKRGILPILEEVEIGARWGERDPVLGTLQKSLIKESKSLQTQSFTNYYFIQQLYSRVYSESEPNNSLLKDMEESLARVSRQKGSLWLKRCNRITAGNFSPRPIYCAAFSPDGALMASGNHDQIVLLDPITNKQNHTLLAQFAGCHAIAFDSQGKYILAGHMNNLKLWNMAEMQPVFIFSGHSDWVTDIAFSTLSKTAASASKDRTIRIWDIKNNKQITLIKEHEEIIYSLCFSPDGNYLLSGGQEKTIRLWQATKGKLVSVMKGHAGAITALSFSPDQHTCISGSKDGTIRAWDVFNGKLLSTLIGHRGIVTSLAFSQDGNYIVSGSSDCTLKIWESKTSKVLQTFTGDNGMVKCQFGNNSDEIWACDSQSFIYKFKIIKIS